MTTTVDSLPRGELRRRLRRGSLQLRIGPFDVRVRSGIRAFESWLRQLYGDYAVTSGSGFADFHVRLDPPLSPRRWWRPQVQFSLDGELPFKPLPRSQACPFFEWGLNWCVAQRAHEYLIIHAAVVARAEGQALLMPGGPGAGKSTLCAALVARGWRLFSDELVLLRAASGSSIDPLPRPISLKNASIDIVRRLAPDARFGPPCHDTVKGTVAHLRAPRTSVAAARVPACPRWLVFPEFQQGAAAGLEPVSPEVALRDLIDNTFNYSVQGAAGFHALAELVGQCAPRRLVFGDVVEACGIVDRLAAERPEDGPLDERV